MNRPYISSNQVLEPTEHPDSREPASSQELRLTHGPHEPAARVSYSPMDLDLLDPAPHGPAPKGSYSPMDLDPALLAERLAASVRETMASTSTSCGSWASSSATRRVSVHVPWGIAIKARAG